MEKYAHLGEIVAKKGDYEAIDCSVCGFIHVFPLPPEEELERYYSKIFYGAERKPDYFQKQRAQKEWWNRVFDDRLEKIENILGRKGHILDVGCGPGFFLARARERGWRVSGVEPSPHAVSFANSELGLSVCLGEIETFTSDECFDVIHSHGVIEHVLSPHNFVSRTREMMCEDAVMFASVANDFSPIQKILQARGFPDWWFVPPEHINYFQVQTFKSLFERHGLDPIDVTTTFPIEFFLLFGDDYVRNPEIGGSCHNRRVNFENAFIETGNKALLNDFYNNLSSLGFGRQIECLSRVKK